jgi:3-oxoacyl-[acyl-carrier-protein] synthase-3
VYKRQDTEFVSEYYTIIIMTKIYARISAVGGYLPKNKITNDQLVSWLATKGVETSSEWIQTRTGIESRYISNVQHQQIDLIKYNENNDDLETTVYMAHQAVNDLFSSEKLDKNKKIDAIIVATTTPDNVFPSSACLIQDALLKKGYEGVKHCMAFDVQAVCSGFSYALSVANGLIQSETIKTALVIGSENLTRLIDFNDRNTCVLFGDGAGCILLEASTETGILATECHADGELKNILSVPAHINAGVLHNSAFLTMEGQAVFKNAVNHMGNLAMSLIEKSGHKLHDVDYLVPHQANIRIIQSIGKKLNIADEQVVITVNEQGNTSAASIPLALWQHHRQHGFKANQLIVTIAAGAGFTWGGSILRW